MMLINYTVCHVLEGQNREDREKGKESGVQQRKQKEESRGSGEKRAGCTLKGGNWKWAGGNSKGKEKIS